MTEQTRTLIRFMCPSCGAAPGESCQAPWGNAVMPCLERLVFRAPCPTCAAIPGQDCRGTVMPRTFHSARRQPVREFMENLIIPDGGLK